MSLAFRSSIERPFRCLYDNIVIMHSRRVITSCSARQCDNSDTADGACSYAGHWATGDNTAASSSSESTIIDGVTQQLLMEHALMLAIGQQVISCLCILEKCDHRWSSTATHSQDRLSAILAMWVVIGRLIQ